MELHLSPKEYRRLLDLAYVGNWILNSCRGSSRFRDYDVLVSRLFSRCPRLCQTVEGISLPSREYVEGGIHEVISCYEDAVFYQILAEEMARRDMGCPEITEENHGELLDRMDQYLDQFSVYGVAHLYLEDLPS